MTTYDETTKDTEGDTARVVARTIDPDSVEVWARQSLGNLGVYLNFTPDAARAFAKHLKRAANVAEGKPAKLRKRDADQLVDRDRDVWTRQADGHYTSPGLENRTFDQIKDAFGPVKAVR
jgi:hypothetical protein